MIPRAYITAWRAYAPWIPDEQVEQDLLLSRILVEIFSHPELQAKVAFRGGTALNKLIFRPASRYSEDIDLVQLHGEGIGTIINPMQRLLEPLLGRANTNRRRHSTRLGYRWTAESGIPMGLKIEINTREHTPHRALERMPFAVENPWITAAAEVVTYHPAELLGTKLRALYQRKKGRDLYDLWMALERRIAPPADIVGSFQFYMARDDHRVGRAQFEENLIRKMRDPEFLNDTPPLLIDEAQFEIARAHRRVAADLLTLLPGEPWRGTATMRDAQRLVGHHEA